MNKKVFLDVSPIIYYLEKHEKYFLNTARIFEALLRRGCKFYTSTISDAEFLAKPLRDDNQILVDEYFTFLKVFDIYKNDINENISCLTALLRSKYSWLKTPDGLQIASAIYNKCDIFLTNDKALTKVEEVKVILINEIE